MEADNFIYNFVILWIYGCFKTLTPNILQLMDFF